MRQVAESREDDAKLGEVPDLSDDKIKDTIAEIQATIKKILK